MLYDVIIVGGGPIGLACGLEAHSAGLQYLILEKGCLVNSLYNYPVNMTFFSTSEKLEIGGITFVSNNIKPSRLDALEYYRRVSQSAKSRIHLFEEVLHITPTVGVKTVLTSKGSYQCRNLVIATGFYDIPNLLNVPGEQLPKVVHYYREPHYYAGQRVVVVGANNSAVDAALECYRKGAEVTMVVRGKEITDRVKYWVKPDIENRIKAGEIQAFFNSEIKEIRAFDLDVNTPDGQVTMANDFVIAMTGYQPNFHFLESLGITFSGDGKRTPKYNPDTQESNVPGIYLAGVVCGGLDTRAWFIENSIVHASTIVKAIVHNQLFENAATDNISDSNQY